jgi:RNase P subunit RPR2
VPTSQQFICKRCRTLVNVQTFEKTKDGVYFWRCAECNAKNTVVQTGATASQPGILPVTGLID